jgi:formylglycine-generating enzyme
VQRVSREFLFVGACALTPLGFSCQLLTDAHERGLNPELANDSGRDARGGSSGGGQTDASSRDGQADALEEPPIVTCPEGLEGPALIPVASNGSGYCIDATEVTNAHYQRFLSAGPRLDRSARCSWNTSFAPANGLRGLDDNPVTNVDWCDAYSYCQSVHKRLCGAVEDGRVVPFGDFAVAEVDEWYNACSSGGVNAYPYGNEFSGGICNGLENGASLKPAGFTDSCLVAGIYDLSGNAAEWENSCDGDESRSDNCRLRGGDYLGRAETLACAADMVFQRDAVGPEVGFRCCQGMFLP